MNDEGRELMKAAVDALERSAVANEAILELATKEQLVMAEPGPPVCPHCGAVNPTVTELETGGGSGPLGGFVIVVEGHCCNKTFFALPQGLDTFASMDAIQAFVNERAGT